MPIAKTASGRCARVLFPFVGIVGQEQMKRALLLNAICPGIGGVLIRGEKGTAKSTAARGLAELLTPAPNAPAGVPFVDLPLSATEDRIVGAIDLEQAIVHGRPALQPGLLHRVHGGILYIDEVNLLDDHLVDCILDASESGINRIEREGLSAWHPARFILVGSMNPEEGDLRPQLLDRFGLMVDVAGEKEAATRKKLLLNREAFDAQPMAFRAQYREESHALKSKLAQAGRRFHQVKIPDHLLSFITEICMRNHVAGHRADLVIQKAAQALAAWHERTTVTPQDISEVAPMALFHRMRNSQPPDMPPEEGDGETPENELHAPPSALPDQPEQKPDNAPEDADGAPPRMPHGAGGAPDDIQAIGDPFKVRRLHRDDQRTLRKGSGRRSQTRSANRQGRYVKSAPRVWHNDLAIDATIRAAAPFQKWRRAHAQNDLAIHVIPSDQRGKIRERRVGSFMIFAVDASGSMAAQKRMKETKAAIMSLLLDAYQKRDRIAMLAFRGRQSQWILPPTNSMHSAAKKLAELPVGGRTPLPSALVEVEKMLERIYRKEPGIMPMVLLLTDGRANAGLGEKHPPHKEALILATRLGARFSGAHYIVVDTEPKRFTHLDLACRIAQALGADYFHTEDLKAEHLILLSRQSERPS